MTYLEQFHSQWQEARSRIENAPQPVEKPTNKRTIYFRKALPAAPLPRAIPAPVRRTAGSWSLTEINRVLALRERGKTFGEIANILGVTRNSVCGVFTRARRDGLSLPKQRKQKDWFPVIRAMGYATLGFPVPKDSPCKGAEIARQCCEEFQLTFTEVKGERRWRPLVACRALIAHRLTTELGWSLPRVGRFLGGRDHTSILHIIRRFEAGYYAEWVS